MKEIFILILYVLLYVMNVFLGGWCIQEAIAAFKDKRYFRFGLEVMLVIGIAAMLIKNIFRV